MMVNTKIAGLQPWHECTIHLLETLLHDNRSIGQWKSMKVREKILSSFAVDEKQYNRNQVIYDIRKLRAHGLVEKLHRSNRYRLTTYGVKIALAFTLMHKRFYGPLHYSLLENQPHHSIATSSKLERMHRRLDSDINEIQDYLSGWQAA